VKRWLLAIATVAMAACSDAAYSASRAQQRPGAVRIVKQTYYAALKLKRCSRVDHYYISLHPHAAAIEGRIWPELVPELARLKGLRRLAVAKRLGAVIADAEKRWRDEDSRADYVCGDSTGAQRARVFHLTNDDLQAALAAL
jgi:hypothetical protein